MIVGSEALRPKGRGLRGSEPVNFFEAQNIEQRMMNVEGKKSSFEIPCSLFDIQYAKTDSLPGLITATALQFAAC
jgi:hypothetical protein